MLYLLLLVGNFFGDQINPRHVLEDAYDGLVQLSNNPELAGAFSLTVISIGKKLGEGEVRNRLFGLHIRNYQATLVTIG